MKYIFRILLFITPFTVKAGGADSTLTKKDFIISIHTGVCFSYVPLTNLNNAMKAMNGSTFNSYPVGVAFGGALGIGRTRLEIHTMLTSTYSELFSDANIRSNITTGFFAFEYDIIKKKKYSFYPLIGVGTTNILNRIYYNPRNASFNSFVSGTGNTSTIINGTYTFNFGLGLDLRPPKFPGSCRIRVGYNYAPVPTEWSSPVGNFSNAPKDDLSYGYIQVMLGFPDAHSPRK
jgi:hypothetical protein